MKDLNVTFREKKDSVAFEGMIITSDTAFFKRLGWKKDEDTSYVVIDFFNRCYEFALQEIGYNGTDKNVLSAVIHLDETTPHLQLYYIPIVDTAKKKVYEKGTDGKVKRNEKGSPIQKKDERGKSLYEYVPLEQPKLCSSDFWSERGGQLSYGNMQDRFYEQISIHYGLGRGEVGSNKKHTTKYQWQKHKQEAELAALEAEKTRAEEIIGQATEAEAIISEAEPVKELLEDYEKAKSEKIPFSGKKKDEQIIALRTKNEQLEREIKVRGKDQEYLYKQLQETTRRNNSEDTAYRMVSDILSAYPDEFDALLRKARTKKSPTPFKSNHNGKGGK